ncbi:hypothetical protein [Pseudomonas aeruginosa]|uniref:hypothetical protein n=1 Tax=Pseudomonas aeruginosa TaxID=287 RepID=UPI0034E0D11E
MNTITCPGCGQQANAFGSVTSCWCDKMYCDHVQGLFASYSCTHCGSSGETPEAMRHKEHQLSKFKAEMDNDSHDLLVEIEGKVKSTFATQSAAVVGQELQVAFSSGASASVTVTNPYSSPAEFQVVSNGGTQKAKGKAELKQSLAAIAGE